MRILSVIAGLGLALSSSPVFTQHHNAPSEIGEQTRSWLALQRDGQAASEQPQPVSGPVAARIYERYQESFRYPIPEYYSGNDADASVLGD